MFASLALISCHDEAAFQPYNRSNAIAIGRVDLVYLIDIILAVSHVDDSYPNQGFVRILPRLDVDGEMFGPPRDMNAGFESVAVATADPTRNTHPSIIVANM